MCIVPSANVLLRLCSAFPENSRAAFHLAFQQLAARRLLELAREGAPHVCLSVCLRVCVWVCLSACVCLNPHILRHPQSIQGGRWIC